jgi:hypothetical protein
MSTKAEDLAKQLLEKTESRKLKWQFVADPTLEVYRSDAGEALAFTIKRKARGDDKVITFELTEQDRVVLSDVETNVSEPANSALLREQAMSFILNRSADPLLQVAGDARIKRFRLYSDLFYAARATADGGDQAIEKAEQFLARLA